MKTNNAKNKSNKGSVLFVTISVTTIAVLVLAAYLMSVQQQVASVSRSQTWNATISVAEAGMEDAMAMVNYGTPNIIVNQWAWTNSLVSGGWVVNGTVATKTNYVYGSNYYVATIDWTSGSSPVISSVGVVSFTPVPWVFSALSGRPFLAVAGATTGTSTSTSTSTVSLGRKIQVTTVNNPLFSCAVVCKTNFDMKGNNCLVDSFDSTSSAYSTSGMYDVNKRQANGNVATDSVLTNSINIGNGNIYGYVYTGPGSQQSCVGIGSQGEVGDTNYQSFAKNKGTIQTGHWAPNFNMYIPDVSAPSLTGALSSLPPATNGVITLTGNNSYVLTGTTTLNVTVAGNNTVWLDSHGSFSLGVTMTNGGQLVLYLGEATGSGDSLGWSGNGTCNVPGYAKNLQIYGLPSLTSVDFHGNAAWTGVLYAPEASFTGGGGGNNNQDTSGAVVVNGCTLNGHWNFHYDQSLTNAGPTRGWVATGWKEVPYTNGVASN